jgi:hypothetical protein
MASRISQARLFIGADRAQQAIAVVTFFEVLVSTYKQALSFTASSEGQASVPLEFVAFNFAKITVTVGNVTETFDARTSTS